MPGPLAHLRVLDLTTRRFAPAAWALVVLLLGSVFVHRAGGQTIAPPFDADYSATNLGSVSGVTTPYGGLTFQLGDPNRLLIGGGANGSAGRIFSISVVRDGNNAITGFSGTAAMFAAAPFIDGGLAFGPGNVLFYTRYSSNEIGQIRLGSSTTDKVVGLTALGVSSSVGALSFVPAGLPGAGQFKVASYNAGTWYTVALSADGGGTFNLDSATLNTTIAGGPEGIIYVPPGSPQFTNPSMLVAEYSAGRVSAYDIDSNGNPVLATRRTFVSGLSGAEGAVLDPLTNDFLFSTFGGLNRVIVVRGFAAPATETPTHTPTGTPTQTPTTTPTNSPTSVPSATASQTQAPTDTPGDDTPVATGTPTITGMPTPSATPSPTATATDLPTESPTLSPSPTPSQTSTATAVDVPTTTPTASPTPTFHATATATDTATPPSTATALPTVTPTPTSAPIVIGGFVFRPGSRGQGLVGVADATVSAFICDRRELCLDNPGMPVATAVTSRSGLFTMAIPADPFRANLLLFDVTVDGAPLRHVLVLSPLPGAAAVGAGGGIPQARIDPISEAVVRLLDDAGLENFDDAGIEAVAGAVRNANADTVFDELSVAAAATLATDTAASDPMVQQVLAERVTPTPNPPCAGDCGGDGAVRIDELVRGVNIALGNQALEVCPAFDRNGNGAVTIDELIAAVNALLLGCPP